MHIHFYTEYGNLMVGMIKYLLYSFILMSAMNGDSMGDIFFAVRERSCFIHLWISVFLCLALLHSVLLCYCLALCSVLLYLVGSAFNKCFSTSARSHFHTVMGFSWKLF
jgi:hypothetical protein